MDKDIVSLHEFLSLSGLTEKELITLMSQGELALEFGESKEVLINLRHCPLHLLTQMKKSEEHLFPPGSMELIEEIIASEVANAIEGIVEEALELSKRWHTENAS